MSKLKDCQIVQCLHCRGSGLHNNQIRNSLTITSGSKEAIRHVCVCADRVSAASGSVGWHVRVRQEGIQCSDLASVCMCVCVQEVDPLKWG